MHAMLETNRRRLRGSTYLGKSSVGNVWRLCDGGKHQIYAKACFIGGQGSFRFVWASFSLLEVVVTGTGQIGEGSCLFTPQRNHGEWCGPAPVFGVLPSFGFATCYVEAYCVVVFILGFRLV